jgi:hypothetical protein
VTATAGVNAKILSGQLAVAGVDPRDVTSVVSGQSSYATGSCAPGAVTYGCQPDATPTDTQIASVALPKAADDITVKIKEKPAGLPGALGMATVFRAGDPGVNRQDPVVLELRYDASIVGSFTPASAVAVAQKQTYRDLVDCDATGQPPAGTTGCVDRRAGQSRFDSDGDLVMVVRTLHFSRYICR